MSKIYSNEEILEQLRLLAKNIGQTPSSKQIGLASTLGYIVSTRTIFLRFGSLRNAQALAGLTPNKANRTYTPKFTKDQLTRQLQELGVLLGRTPTLADVYTSKVSIELASVGTFQKNFGTFLNALTAAGYTNIENRKQVSHRDESILFEFLADAAKYFDDVVPSIMAFNRYASTHTSGCQAKRLTGRYGSLELAFAAAGLEVIVLNNDERLDMQQLDHRDEYIVALQEYAKRVGHTPSTDEIKYAKSAGQFPFSYRTVYRLFGSWQSALDAAGLKPTKRDSTEVFVKELSRMDYAVLQQLRDLAQELGHTPSGEEYNTAFQQGKIVSNATVIKQFVSMKNAIQLAGLVPRKRGRPGKSTPLS